MVNIICAFVMLVCTIIFIVWTCVYMKVWRIYATYDWCKENNPHKLETLQCNKCKSYFLKRKHSSYLHCPHCGEDP